MDFPHNHPTFPPHLEVAADDRLMRDALAAWLLKLMDLGEEPCVITARASGLLRGAMLDAMAEEVSRLTRESVPPPF